MTTSRGDKVRKGEAMPAPAAKRGDVEAFETVSVTRAVLEETPGRALTLLMAMHRNRAIRAAMESVGCLPAQRADGWNRLRAVTVDSETSDGGDGDTSVVETSVRDAVLALDEADEDLVRVVRATLTHSFPAQAGAVLKGVKAGEGGAAVLTVATILGRLEGLKSSGLGRAALERLSARGLTAARRGQLATWVEVAQGAGLAPVFDREKDAELAARKDGEDAEYLRALRALRAWYEEWSELARTVVARRDYLILMGLGERKAKAKERATTEVEE
ncbi:MAG: hypothetical protein HY909_16745 [Deltaproteobacteria bacterium]|nr:hypothetical protein [Deltaproteobacteria bacterium]